MMSGLAVGYDCTKKSLPLTCSATLSCYLILLPYPDRPYPGFILALHLTICSLKRTNGSLDCWTSCWRREAQETGGEDFISLLHLLNLLHLCSTSAPTPLRFYDLILSAPFFLTVLFFYKEICSLWPEKGCILLKRSDLNIWSIC